MDQWSLNQPEFLSDWRLAAKSGTRPRIPEYRREYVCRFLWEPGSSGHEYICENENASGPNPELRRADVASAILDLGMGADRRTRQCSIEWTRQIWAVHEAKRSRIVLQCHQSQ